MYVHYFDIPITHIFIDQKSLAKSYEEKKIEMTQRIELRRTLFERVQLDAARNQARSKINMVDIIGP
jgi:hypothetical protein